MFKNRACCLLLYLSLMHFTYKRLKAVPIYLYQIFEKFILQNIIEICQMRRLQMILTFSS